MLVNRERASSQIARHPGRVAELPVGVVDFRIDSRRERIPLPHKVEALLEPRLVCARFLSDIVSRTSRFLSDFWLADAVARLAERGDRGSSAWNGNARGRLDGDGEPIAKRHYDQLAINGG